MATMMILNFAKKGENRVMMALELAKQSHVLRLVYVSGQQVMFLIFLKIVNFVIIIKRSYIVTRGDRFVGNMMGGSDMESSMGSEDSDSDLDLADDLQSDDDETIVKLTGEGSSNKAKSKPIDHSDEDF